MKGLWRERKDLETNTILILAIYLIIALIILIMMMKFFIPLKTTRKKIRKMTTKTRKITAAQTETESTKLEGNTMNLDEMTETESTKLEENTMNLDEMAEKAIDINKIGEKILSTNDKMRESIKKSQQIITAKRLVKSLPELAGLGDIPVISIRYFNGLYQTFIPCVYQDTNSDGEVIAVVCLPDLNATITDQFTIAGYRTGRRSYSILRHVLSGLLIKGALSANQDYLNDLEVDEKECDESPTTLDPSWLKELPRIEISLKRLPLNTEFTITKTGTYSKQHKTPLIDVKDLNNNIYQNVICNSSLGRLSSWKGIGKRFMITSIVESESKFGNKTFCAILPIDDGAKFDKI